MPLYISLGSACNVRHQMDKYNKRQEDQGTLFFDWLKKISGHKRYLLSLLLSYFLP